MASREGLKNYSEGFYNWMSVESIKNAIKFQPRATDVIISTFPKSGTTWLLQITHQLRTGGDMNFDEIDDVLPYMETALEKNLDLNAEQKANPRLFKTHHPSSHCPKNCKNIVVWRNPFSVAYSHFKFVQYYHVIPPTVTLDDFVQGSWLGHPDMPNSLWPLHVSYFTHLLGWYKHRNDPSTLIVFFEEMKADLEKVVRVIAAFIGIEDEENIQAALSMSSFSFMKKNNVKFDFSAPTLPKKPGEAMFIRTGTVDEGPKNLPNESKAAIQEKWKETVAKVTGCETYDELRRRLREERPL